MNTAGANPDLRQELRVAFRLAWIVVGVTVIGGALGYGYSRTQSTIHESKVTVRVLDPNDVRANNSTDLARQVELQVRFAESTELRATVDARLGDDAHKVDSFSVSGLAVTDALEIAADTTTQRFAPTAATAFAEVYIETARQQLATRLSTDAQGLRAQAAAVETQVAAVDRQIADLSPPTVIDTTGRPVTANIPPAITALQNQRQELASQSATLNNEAARLEASIPGRQSSISIVAPASKSELVLPHTTLNTAIGLVLGLLIGLGLAAMRHRLDDRVRTAADVSEVCGHDLLMACIPPLDRQSRKSLNPVRALDAPGPLVESFRLLRAQLLFATDNTPTALLVTSPDSGDGKTSLAAMTAVALARAGNEVTLIDCDLRNSKLHEVFGLRNQVGFSTVMNGGDLAGSMQRVLVPGGSINVLTAGPPPENPAELLLSIDAARVITSLRQQSGMVILDSPPLLPVADALTLAWLTDAALVVARSGKTSGRALGEAVARLTDVSANILGVVLLGATGADTSSAYYRAPQAHVPANGASTAPVGGATGRSR